MPQGPNPFSQIIASRPLTWVDQDGNWNTALVEIGCPYPNPGLPNTPDDPWCCAVRTTGLMADTFQPVFYGVDSLEALLQAISDGGVAVNSVPFSAGLDWAVATYCGFPIYPAPADNAGGGGAAPAPCDGEIQLEPIGKNPD